MLEVKYFVPGNQSLKHYKPENLEEYTPVRDLTSAVQAGRKK